MTGTSRALEVELSPIKVNIPDGGIFADDVVLRVSNHGHPLRHH